MIFCGGREPVVGLQVTLVIRFFLEQKFHHPANVSNHNYITALQFHPSDSLLFAKAYDSFDYCDIKHQQCY